MPRGRSTKYDVKALNEAESYVEKCHDSNTIPYIEELALLLSVDDDTLVEWAKQHDEFSATLKRLKMLQKLYLKQGALEKRLQPHIAVFLLKANHGLNEKEPSYGEPMQVNVISYAGLSEILRKADSTEKD